MTVEGVGSVETGALVAQAQAGDARAFGELMTRHRAEVYAVALRMVADREMAADVTQEAFVRAWRGLPRFRGESRFSTWIHRIAINVSLDHRKRKNRERTTSIDHPSVPEPTDGGLTPERAAESVALRDDLEAALRALPDDARTVVVLKDVHGWSHGEIAEHLGITVTAAKVRLHRARKQLRSMLWPKVRP